MAEDFEELLLGTSGQSTWLTREWSRWLMREMADEREVLTRGELQDLCKQKKIRANDTSVNMATALEALRCSAVAAANDGSAAEDDDEDVEDDED